MRGLFYASHMKYGWIFPQNTEGTINRARTSPQGLQAPSAASPSLHHHLLKIIKTFGAFPSKLPVKTIVLVCFQNSFIKPNRANSPAVPRFSV